MLENNERHKLINGLRAGQTVIIVKHLDPHRWFNELPPPVRMVIYW